MTFDDLPFLVLGARGTSQSGGAEVFLLFTHEKILDPGGIAHHKDEHSCRHRVERSAMSDLLGSEAATGNGDHIMRGHAGGFVYQEDSVN